MDCSNNSIQSRNQIDLKYLTNPNFSSIVHNTLNSNTANHININTNDLSLYRKRIFLLTRDYLKGKSSEDASLDNIFYKYAQSCIDYFKFKDTTEIIQKDYIKYNNKGKKNIYKNGVSKFTTEKGDNLIMHKKKQSIPKITDVMNIKRNTQDAKLIIPKIRNIQYNGDK